MELWQNILILIGAGLCIRIGWVLREMKMEKDKNERL